MVYKQVKCFFEPAYYLFIMTCIYRNKQFVETYNERDPFSYSNPYLKWSVKHIKHQLVLFIFLLYWLNRIYIHLSKIKKNPLYLELGIGNAVKCNWNHEYNSFMLNWQLSSVKVFAISKCRINIRFFVLQKCFAYTYTTFSCRELLCIYDETLSVLFDKSLKLSFHLNIQNSWELNLFR